MTFQGSAAGMLIGGLFVILTAKVWARISLAVARRLAVIVARDGLSSLVDEHRFSKILTYMYLAIGVVLAVVALIRMI